MEERETGDAMRILVVDDDPAVRRSLERALRLENYEVTLADDGRQALSELAVGSFDAVILDILMPEVDGVDVCRRLREAGDDTPVLLLTARDAVPDRVRGLDAGADDYLPKPFALVELMARLRALLRRKQPADGTTLRFGDLELDRLAYEVRRGGKPITLTRTEFSLLEMFLRHPRQVLTREVIMDRVWGWESESTSNSLEVYIGYLRRKTEISGEPRIIHTVRGVGYVLREP